MPIMQQAVQFTYAVNLHSDRKAVHDANDSSLVHSYTRHVSYCRRTHDKLRRRPRPCQTCKVAKAKCTFDSPCSRCNAKGLDCVSEGHVVPQRLSSTTHDELMDVLPAFEPPTMPSTELVASSDNDADRAAQMDEFQSITPVDIDDSLSTWPDLDLSLFSNELVRKTPPSGWLESDHESKYLTRLRRSTPVAQQSALLLFEALCAIPEQMMRKETFPPFIYPYWNHSVPEPISVCVQIARMFSKRTAETKLFIWRTILNEQRRIVEKVRIQPLVYTTSLTRIIQRCPRFRHETCFPLYSVAWCT